MQTMPAIGTAVSFVGNLVIGSFKGTVVTCSPAIVGETRMVSLSWRSPLCRMPEGRSVVLVIGHRVSTAALAMLMSNGMIAREAESVRRPVTNRRQECLYRKRGRQHQGRLRRSWAIQCSDSHQTSHPSQRHW